MSDSGPMTDRTSSGTSTPTVDGPSPIEVDEFIAVVTMFGDRCRNALFGGAQGIGTGPDGDLSVLPDLLAGAWSMGLMADASSGPGDGDLGVWGSSTLAVGPSMSLSTLAVLAETCAGLAATVHAQGVARFALADRPSGHDDRVVADGPDSTVAALFVPEVGTLLDHRTIGQRVVATSDRSDTPRAATDTSDAGTIGGLLDGRSRFVWASGEPDRLVVVAHRGSEPLMVVVDAHSPGVRLERTSGHVGLRALPQFDVELVGVPFAPGDVIAVGTRAASLIARMSAIDWLGVSAIALGTARAAVREASAYATTRVQGGRTIIEHASVRMLLAGATHDVATLSALIRALPERPITTIEDDELLRCALTARLGMADHAFRAVSNSVQVLGGYGYMDDYGISKRLRDVGALRSRHGNREQLLLAIADLATRGPADRPDPQRSVVQS